MKHLTKSLALATLLFAPTSLLANSFCAELSSRDQLPQKYAKRGPFHASVSSGWIVGQDQMKANFSVTEEVVTLLKDIKAAFETKGVKLSALIAPPRPLFAPNAAKEWGYDAHAVTEKFSAYIDALNEAGIAAPDLSGLASGNLVGDFYFARDTHWTPRGAAISATHLGQMLNSTDTVDILQTVEFSEEYLEKGSLSTVVEKTCGFRPGPETVAAPKYAKSGNASTLLGNSEEATVALVGTSFSDRYKRDAYQVAGAVSHALRAPVDNFSITGGGLVGAMEAFITSGALESGQYKTVVWESPYTSPLTDVNGLRQILGALEQSGKKNEVFSGKLSSEWTPIKQQFAVGDYRVLSVRIPGVSEGKMEIEMYNSKGDKSRIKLVKSDRIPARDRSDTWTMALSAFPLEDVSRFKVKLQGGAQKASIYLIN